MLWEWGDYVEGLGDGLDWGTWCAIPKESIFKNIKKIVK